MDEVTAAEERMIRARDALMSYIESPPPEGIARDRHRRLLNRLRAATEQFMRAVEGLDR